MSYYQRDMVTDVVAVLKTIRDEFSKSKNYRNTTELRKEAVRLIAELELRARRYKNTDSAQKTIHDACARRLRPQVANIGDFDNLVDQWLRKNSMQLKDVLLGHAESRLQRSEVDQWFEQGENRISV
jgi:hypothetical protein